MNDLEQIGPILSRLNVNDLLAVGRMVNTNLKRAYAQADADALAKIKIGDLYLTEGLSRKMTGQVVKVLSARGARFLVETVADRRSIMPRFVNMDGSAYQCLVPPSSLKPI